QVISRILRAKPTNSFPLRRTFHWVSSSNPKEDSRLLALSAAMQSFYSQRETREAYQRMVDSEESSQPATEGALMRAVVDLRPSSVLEVGCGSGRIYQRLRAQGCRSSYTGVELSAEVVRENMRRFPEGNWLCGSGYDLPLRDASQDCVFAYYVLEHCVFPERFLRSLLRVTRPGGSLILAFPDFHVAGLCGS